MKVTKLEEGITKEMMDWFEKRTKKHIALVQKYGKKIIALDPEAWKALAPRLEEHDASKLKQPEMIPYVWVTWKYKCQDDGVDFDPPDDIDQMMNLATGHHVKHNRHHPESCDPDAKEDDCINKGDRDKPPEKMVDGTSMKPVDIAEMVADWCAMSEERGNSPKEWADKNVNVRWKFDGEQSDLIYELIGEIWE